MFIGVDVGGTNMSAGLFDDDKNLLATAKVKSKGKEPTGVVLAQLFKVINKLLDDNNKSSLKAIGIGIAGFVDSAAGVLKFSANLNLDGVCIKDDDRQRWSVLSKLRFARLFRNLCRKSGY
jgi:glucokinase